MSCIKIPTSCPDDYSWDVATGTCIYEIHVCPHDFYWNGPANKCDCWPQVCSLNRVWDSSLCLCSVTPKTCATNERWDEELGNCIKFTDCFYAFESSWGYRDSTTDDCICGDQGNCNNGVVAPASSRYWDHTTCQCVHSFTDCPEGQYRDTNSGLCRYYTSCECPVGSQFDQVTGECSCLPQVCPSGFYYNMESCSCECLPVTC